MATNTAIVQGASLTNVAANTAIVQGASLATVGSSSSNTAQVSGAMLVTGALEPFTTLRLPGDGPWMQTAGPTTATPTVLMPAAPSPGTAVSYTAPNGTVQSFNVLPHTIFGRDAAGKLFPIRKRPYLGPGTLDPGPVTPAAPTMPIGDIVANGHNWHQVFAEDFNTDVPVGGFTPKVSSPGSGSLVTGAAAAPYGSKLTVYPSGFGASSNGKSRPEKVLSVSNSCLTYDFSIDATTGEAMAATVHYLIGSNTYGGGTTGYYIDPTVGGRFEFRFKVVNGPALTGWGAVAQLIANDADWGAMHGELDIIEGSLSANMETNQHWYGAPNVFTRWGTQPYGNNVWHTAVTEWVPVGNASEPAGRETVWIDGVKIGESLGDRVAQNNRAFIAFQTGVNSAPPAAGGIYPADGVIRGQLLVDYVVAYAPFDAAAATVPGAPTSVSATPGDTSATVTFTAPGDGGAAITTYTATASPGGATGTASNSPITVAGLTNGTAYTFTVRATNSVGIGSASAATTAITPAASSSVTHGINVTAANTGIAGKGLTQSNLTTVTGSPTYSTNGQTISLKLFTDTVTLAGNNITLDRCMIRIPGSADNVGVINTGTGNIVQDCTILASSGSHYQSVHHANGTSFTLLRSDVSGGENIITCEADGMIVDSSYLHGTSLASNSSGHADVIEIYGGNNHAIRYSKLVQTAGLGDSPINIAPYYGSTSVNGVTISDTFIDGGNSHLLVDLQSTGTVTNVKVLRCKMGGHTDNGIYSAFQDNDGRGTVQTSAAQTSNPNAVLWPNTGADLSTWQLCTGLSPDRTGQTMVV